MLRVSGLLLASGLAFGALSVAQNPAASLPAGVTPEMVQQGESLYQGTGLCVACHGPLGRGGVGPDLTDSVWVIGTGTLPELIGRITRGVPADSSVSGNEMPPLGGSNLSESEVRMIAAYVWTLSHPGKKS